MLIRRCSLTPAAAARPKPPVIYSWALTLAVVLAAAPAFGQPFEIGADQERVTVTAGERPVFVYRFGNVPAKPYVEALYTPGGINVLRDAPSDHLHHHGLMFAVSVGEVSFWEEKDGSGRQRHGGFERLWAKSRDGRKQAALVETLRWLAPPSEDALLTELRTIAVCPAEQLAATLLTWDTRLTAPAEQQRVLGGSHYYGLGMRFVEAMDRDGTMLSAAGQAGETVRGSERLVGAKWVAYTAVVDGKTVTAALFDHPGNPRHPARMFTMTAPFAYLSATMNLWKEPLRMAPGQTLHLRYGVAACDGHLTAEDVEQLHALWLQQVEARPSSVQGPAP
ncbi:MAG: PmoA family protein [Patescibacteria group bacterium]|nr:PmoA family protein [Patescibacteria group bacterium]